MLPARSTARTSQCIAALTTGERLRGTWFDRSAEFEARQRGDNLLPTQFAKSYDIKLTPLPCHSHLSPDRRQAEYRRMVAEGHRARLVPLPSADLVRVVGPHEFIFQGTQPRFMMYESVTASAPPRSHRQGFVMKHAWGFSAVNRTMGLVCLLLGCTIDNPGIYDNAKPVHWDGAVRMLPGAMGTESGDGGAGFGGGSGAGLDPTKVYFRSNFTIFNNPNHQGLYDVETAVLAGELPFDDGIYGGILRPTDGAFVYEHEDSKTGKFSIRMTLPGAGQVPVALPACAVAEIGGHWSTNPWRNWYLAPDTGELLYACGLTDQLNDTITYTYVSGASFQLERNYSKLLAIGYNGTYLTKDVPGRLVIINADGTKTVAYSNWSGADVVDVDEIRATPTGFLIVQKDYPSTNDLTLWQLGFDGTCHEELLPKPPPKYEKEKPGTLALDDQGRTVVAMQSGAIVRLTLGGPAEILYEPGDLKPGALINAP